MAERRMISLKVIDTDKFLDMPLSTRYLYHELNARADDDGFIGSPKKIAKMVGGSDDDLRLLAAKEFVIPFRSGVIVIKHWRMNNYIRSDRYNATAYQDEKQMLSIEKNGTYRLVSDDLDTVCTPFGIPDGNQLVGTLDTQVRLGKVSIDKDILPAEVNAFFEKVWALYPNKKGKGQVSKTQKAKLAKIGLEQLTRCIDRYLSELKKDEWRKPQNGSTFFNSGYVDYLDDNFSSIVEGGDKSDNWEGIQRL